MNKLPTIGSQGEAKPNEEVDRELKEMFISREFPFSVFTNKLTKENLKQHIVEPSKKQTMLNSFMILLKKYV